MTMHTLWINGVPWMHGTLASLQIEVKRLSGPSECGRVEAPDLEIHPLGWTEPKEPTLGELLAKI